jgi:2,4-diketo-3-deoxy-L-fuconate hydrolase
MRLVNADGRAAFLVGDEVFDVAELSGGELPSDPMAAIVDHWDALLKLHAAGSILGGRLVHEVRLGPPVPAPRAVFGIGVNYRSHAEETGAPVPEIPAVFTKFPTSVVGPFDNVVLPAGATSVDYEAELAFVVGFGGRRVAAGDALAHLAGFMAAQDVSERRIQFAAGRQFSMGKSFDTFCPTGPALVTLDEIGDPTELRITCRVNGDVMQDARTSDLIVDVPNLVEFLSSVLTLRAGDICLTGTPAGVGMARQPPVFLKPGDVIETVIQDVGTMRNRCVAEN